jgi:hypothetical protein
MQKVQHCYKVFSQCLQCRKLKADEKPKSQIFAAFKIEVFNIFCPLIHLELAQVPQIPLQASNIPSREQTAPYFYTALNTDISYMLKSSLST